MTAEDAGAFTFQAFGQAADLSDSDEAGGTSVDDEATVAVQADEESEFTGLAILSLLDQAALTQIQEIQDTQADAGSLADAQLLRDNLKLFLTEDWWPNATGDPLIQETLDVMVDALYLASLRDGNGDLLFPSVHAGLNLNTQLLTQYHDTGDSSAATALAELTGLLVLQDLAR